MGVRRSRTRVSLHHASGRVCTGRAGAKWYRRSEMAGSDRSHLVRPDQLRRALRLASELRDLAPGSDEQRHHALEGLCGLVGAQVGLWVTVEAVPAGHVVIRTARDHGWSDNRERDIFRRFARSEEAQRRDPSVAAMLRRMNEKERVTSVLRDDLIDSRAWY